MVHTVHNDAGRVTETRSCPAGLDPAVVVRFDEKKKTECGRPHVEPPVPMYALYASDH